MLTILEGFFSLVMKSFHFIRGLAAGFYKPTILEFHPPFYKVTGHTKMQRFGSN
jgi:hypothetical protein